jgi:hypothetical protein
LCPKCGALMRPEPIMPTSTVSRTRGPP